MIFSPKSGFTFVMAMRGGRSESVTFSLGFNHLSEFPLDRLESPCRLIMNFLPQQVTNEDVHGLFSQFGTIVNIKIIRDKGTGLCVGYGFIEFARAEEAAMAIRLGNGRELGSKRVKVWYSRKPTPDMKGSNVYLQNYGPELEGWQLVELFSKFGTVININMLRDKSGKSRGAGFVRMDTNLQALNAVNALNGSLLNGRKIFAKIRETQVSAPFPAQGQISINQIIPIKSTSPQLTHSTSPESELETQSNSLQSQQNILQIEQIQLQQQIKDEQQIYDQIRLQQNLFPIEEKKIINQLNSREISSFYDKKQINEQLTKQNEIKINNSNQLFINDSQTNSLETGFQLINDETQKNYIQGMYQLQREKLQQYQFPQLIDKQNEFNNNSVNNKNRFNINQNLSVNQDQFNKINQYNINSQLQYRENNKFENRIGNQEINIKENINQQQNEMKIEIINGQQFQIYPQQQNLNLNKKLANQEQQNSNQQLNNSKLTPFQQYNNYYMNNLQERKHEMNQFNNQCLQNNSNQQLNTIQNNLDINQLICSDQINQQQLLNIFNLKQIPILQSQNPFQQNLFDQQESTKTNQQLIIYGNGQNEQKDNIDKDKLIINEAIEKKKDFLNEIMNDEKEKKVEVKEEEEMNIYQTINSNIKNSEQYNQSQNQILTENENKRTLKENDKQNDLNIPLISQNNKQSDKTKENVIVIAEPIRKHSGILNHQHKSTQPIEKNIIYGIKNNILKRKQYIRNERIDNLSVDGQMNDPDYLFSQEDNHNYMEIQKKEKQKKKKKGEDLIHKSSHFFSLSNSSHQTFSSPLRSNSLNNELQSQQNSKSYSNKDINAIANTQMHSHTNLQTSPLHPLSIQPQSSPSFLSQSSSSTSSSSYLQQLNQQSINPIQFISPINSPIPQIPISPPPFISHILASPSLIHYNQNSNQSPISRTN